MVAPLATNGPGAFADGGSTVTSYSYASETGDWVGQGTTGTLDSTFSAFTLLGTASGATLLIDGPHERWIIRIEAPTGEQLTAGTTYAANRFRSDGSGGLDVSEATTGDGRGCNATSGNFTVDSLSADATGELTELEVTFEQHCEAASAPALRGNLKVAASQPADLVLSSTNPSVVRDQPVTLNAFVAEPDGGTVTFFDGGQPIAQAPAEGHVVSFTTAALALGDHAMTATYAPADGRSSASSATIVQRVRDGSTSYWFRSTGGEYVGQGATASYTQSASTTFAVQGTASDLTVYVHATDGAWHAEIAAPRGDMLRPGVYRDAERAPFRSNNRPGLDVGGHGRGCNKVSGDFVIHEIRSDARGNVLTLDFSFVQHCEWASSPALEGRVRYHVSSRTQLDSSSSLSYESEDEATFNVAVTALDAPPTGRVVIASRETVLCESVVTEGSAHCALSPSQLPAGNYEVTATYVPDASAAAAGLASSVSEMHPLQIQPAMTRLSAAAVSAVGAADSQRVEYRATLTSEVTGRPLVDEVVTFSPTTSSPVTQSCTARTNAQGVAVCISPLGNPSAVLGASGYRADFAGAASYYPSRATASVSPT